MRKYSLIAILSVVLVLLAAACGPEPTPTPLPTNTPEPTNTPAPTATPEPTLDVTTLSSADIEATIEALETTWEEIEAAASGAAGEAAEGDVASQLFYVERDLEAARALLEDALAREGGEGGEEAAGDEAALTLEGDFSEARGWTLEELEALDMITATVAGPRDDDPEAEYTGVSLVAFLEAAGLGEDATTLTATAADDFSAEIEVAAVQDCENCMIVIEDGTLRLVMPGFASRTWVGDVVSLSAE